MTQTATAKRFDVHPHQLRTLQSKARFVLMAAGTGGGKTYIGPIWLYARIAEYPKDDALVIAPTHRILTNVTYPMLAQHFAETRLAGEFKESKGQYILPTGGTIFLASADNPHSFAGHHVRAAWADEAGLFPRMAWVEMQARVGQKRGRVLFTSTPYGLNWLYADVFKRWQDGNPDYDVIQFASGDSPWYSQEEYDRAKRSLPPALFAMRYDGQFSRSEGMVYPDFHKCIVTDLPDLAGGDLVGGADFGFRNPTAILKASLVDDVLYVTSEFYESESLASAYAAWMGFDHAYVGDPAAAQTIGELHSRGIIIESADNDIDAGIEAVTDRIRTGRLKVSRACSNLIDEAETYEYAEPAERDERRGAKPVKVKDHAMDALRYMCMMLRSRAQKRPFIMSM